MSGETGGLLAVSRLTLTTCSYQLLLTYKPFVAHESTGMAHVLYVQYVQYVQYVLYVEPEGDQETPSHLESDNYLLHSSTEPASLLVDSNPEG